MQCFLLNDKSILSGQSQELLTETNVPIVKLEVVATYPAGAVVGWGEGGMQVLVY